MKVSESTFVDGWGSRRPAQVDEGPTARYLLRAVDGGLMGVVCVAPLFFGGRHDVGRLVFIALVTATATLWFLRQALQPAAQWHRTAAHGIVVMAALLVLLQIVPLPPAWIARLAPHTRELLPLWNMPAEGSSGSEGAAATAADPATATPAPAPAGAAPGEAASNELGKWRTLSLLPHETTKSLAMLIAYGLLFVVVVQRIRNIPDIAKLLNLIAVSSVLMASFGLIQYITSNGRFFWFYEHPYRSTEQFLAGSFANRNHFASFLVLGLAPLAAWFIRVVHSPPSPGAARRAAVLTLHRLSALLLAGGVILLVLAILRSLSRGGAIALVVAASTLTAVCLIRRVIDSRYAYGMIGLAVTVVALLSLGGYDQVARRLDDFAVATLERMDEREGRRKIWGANVSAIQANWLTGAGAGSHREVYPIYLAESRVTEYTHAENGYLQIATETGIGGVALLLAALCLCGKWAIAGWRRSDNVSEIACFGAVVASLAAGAAHSVVDFIWYIPACMSLTLILAACLLRLSQLAGGRSLPAAAEPVRSRPPSSVPAPANHSFASFAEGSATGRPRSAALWWGMTAAVVLLGGWSVYTFVPPAMASIHWDRYLRASVASTRLANDQLFSLLENQSVESAARQKQINDLMLLQLQRVVARDPRLARARLRLASRYIADFEMRQRDAENSMSLSQIRDAAVASRFESADDLRGWLDRALGDNVELLYRAKHEALTAVQLCPLQGEGYVFLSELSFLDGATAADIDCYLDQAIRVRPFDGSVLFEVGKHALLSGDLPTALQLWQKCFRDHGPHQLKIVYLLAGRIPSELFLSVFEPDWRTLPSIWKRYRELGQPQDCEHLIVYATAQTPRQIAAQPGVRADLLWYWLAGMHTDLGQADESLACLERANAASPRQFFVRSALAKALLAAGRHAEAEPHVRWCLARRPEDKSLTAALVVIAKHRLAERAQADGGVFPLRSRAR